MNNILSSIIILFLFSYLSSGAQTVGNPGNTNYKKSDLKKIRWIEGSWRGMYNNKPFYEIYDLVNDSTLKITSYKWNGQDTSDTSNDYVVWKEGAYYLGKQQNWKVSSITEKEIKMIPNGRVSNDIIWKHKNKKSWEAILTSNKGVTRYLMEQFDLPRRG